MTQLDRIPLELCTSVVSSPLTLHTVVVHVLPACWMLNAACFHVPADHRRLRRHAQSNTVVTNGVYPRY